MTKKLVTAVTGIITFVTVFSLFAGCSNSDDDGKVTVVAGFYPLQFISERVGGDHVTAKNLAKPGAEPHDLELSASQIGAISDADLVVYLHGFQPAVDDAVTEHNKKRSLDVAGVQPLHAGYAPNENAEEQSGKLGEDSEHKDPHIWQNPQRLAKVADKLADKLATVDPDHKTDYQANAKKLHAELETLDKEYEQGLTTCESRDFVVSHNAFGYLAERYHLNQISISGLDPETEPSPGRLAEVTNLAKQHNVTVIFFETLVSPRVAKSLANEVNARTEVLDPIESIDPDSDDTYLTLMRTNLKQLRDALQCA